MKQILLHVTEEEKVLAVLDEGVLSDISVEKAEETDLVGRVYKGVIRNVVPSINGMFIDIGIGKNGFLRTKDILSKEPHTEGGICPCAGGEGQHRDERSAPDGENLLCWEICGGSPCNELYRDLQEDPKRRETRIAESNGARHMSFRYGSHRAHCGRKGGDGRASA